jgi:hypothetical protein
VVSFSGDFESEKHYSQKDIDVPKNESSKGQELNHDINPVINQAPVVSADVLPVRENSSYEFNDRQKRILEYMEISPRAKISDFFSFHILTHFFR